MAEKRTSIRELVREGVNLFYESKLYFGHGTLTGFDDAAYLLLHTLKLPVHNLADVLSNVVSESEAAAVRNIFKRRANERVPASYLTHEAWLGEYKFYVDERVIVPRSFIAELLREELFPWVQDADAIHSVLDLCTGSGCLAILAALSFTHAEVDAAELSLDALEVAQKNIADYLLQGQVIAIQSDMFGGLQNKKYDLIISNPPYVTAESMRQLPDEYLREPQMALASGEDGLDHVRIILREAALHLNDFGLLIVEVGFNREGVEAQFPTLPFTWLETSAGDGVVFLLTREELGALREV